MKRLILVTACFGALVFAPFASAQTAAKPAAPKAAQKKPAAKKSTRKAATAGAAGAAGAAAAVPEGTKWNCELGNDLYISGNMERDEVITLHWQGANHKLPRQTTVTGADRYFDARSGLDLVVIPSKAMLFNKNAGQRLADECQTADMQAGGSAPTQAGALRAPVVRPLLVPPSN